MARVLARPDSRPQAVRHFAEGELILLVDKVGRRHRVRLRAGERHSIHSGLIQHDDLIGKPEGTMVTTQLGARLLAVRPTFAEQVTGEFLEAAKRAIVETMGEIPSNLTLKLGDVYAGVEERDVDRVLLDLAEPWQAAAVAKEALRPGGIVFAHCPNVSQVQRFFDCLRELRGFGMLEAFELLQRGWTVRGRSMRPSHRMVAHTGFLCFARRLAGDELFEPEGEGFR